MENKYKNVDEYIKTFPKSTQTLLEQLRKTIKQAAPDAEECISYRMPAYKLSGKPLVYFAGYDKHIGFYATPSGHSEFAGELSKYKQGRGSAQFPVDKPLPFELISRITKFRVKENSTKSR